MWRFINTGKIGSINDDSNFLLAWRFKRQRGAITELVDDNSLITYRQLMNRYQPDDSFDLDNFDFDTRDPDPIPDADSEDGFGITETLYSTISEHVQMLQKGMSSNKVLQPLLDDIAQVLSFRILSEKLTALLEEMSEALRISLAPGQALSTLERFQKQLQQFTLKQVRTSHKPSVAGMTAATGNHGIGVTRVTPETSLSGIRGNHGSVLTLEENNQKASELWDSPEARTLFDQNQNATVYTITVGT